MPSKRVILQSSDSDAPVVVTPRKNTTSLSALLAQDVLLSRASSKQAPRASAPGAALLPATPSHVASPSAAPPKLAKFAAAAARRRASNPRIAGISSAASKTSVPVAEISSSSFYPTKDPEWTKRLARIVGASAAGVDVTDSELNESYLTRVKLVPKPFLKPNNRGNAKYKKLKDALDFRNDPQERRTPMKTNVDGKDTKFKMKKSAVKGGAKGSKRSKTRPTKDFVAVVPKTVEVNARRFSEARASK